MASPSVALCPPCSLIATFARSRQPCLLPLLALSALFAHCRGGEIVYCPFLPVPPKSNCHLWSSHSTHRWSLIRSNRHNNAPNPRRSLIWSILTQGIAKKIESWQYVSFFYANSHLASKKSRPLLTMSEQHRNRNAKIHTQREKLIQIHFRDQLSLQYIIDTHLKHPKRTWDDVFCPKVQTIDEVSFLY